MRLNEKRFSIPFAIFEERMEDKAHRLLCYLFSQSDFNGACSPGYAAMKEGAQIGADTTIKYTLESLRKKGWIFHIKKNGSQSATIWLQVPPRFRKKKRTSAHLQLIEAIA